MKSITQYPEVNQIIDDLSHGIIAIFGEELVGLYLFGSLTYGDYKPGRSDIDIEAITNSLASGEQLAAIENLHKKIEGQYPNWVGRIEASYTPLAMLKEKDPPGDRPYWNGHMYYVATYGNEWIINQYLLYHHGIAIYGPEYKTLVKDVNIKDVQEACRHDFAKEWLPKLTDDKWLSNSHDQSYLVLNLCRILHTVKNGQVSSKSVSAEWVKQQFPEWQELIASAQKWEPGMQMNLELQAKDFILFCKSKLD